MGFLDSVLTSIETGKPSPVPPPAPATRRPSEPQSSSSAANSDARKPNGGARNLPLGSGNTSSGTKRKAEEQLRPAPNPGSQASIGSSTASKPITASTAFRARPSSATTPSHKQSVKPTSSSTVSVASKSNTSVVTSKPPPKGSYADIMMKAKELQQKAPTTVGMFKHQSVPKEKLSKTERRRRAMEAQTKGKDARLGQKSASPGIGVAGKGDIESPRKKQTPEEPVYKGTARSTQPPSQPEYRGTAGLPSRRGSKDRKDQSGYGRRSKLDDYLGTDEEDEGDYADDYYSESSDMEAGLDDVEEEEQAALKTARREDEEEWRAELAAKQAKMNRLKR